jgi:LAS superfamily LD-carboxypeptidase LdcB
MITKNEKGEYALFDAGKLIGFAPVKYIGGVRVIESMYDKVTAMQEAAQKEAIHLTLAAGLRSSTATSDKFSPRTGKPGFSNHQDGQAYDFNVTHFPLVYAWLVKNALRFGFIRTVPTERWHWEYLPQVKDMFAYVKKSNPTWDGLV